MSNDSRKDRHTKKKISRAGLSVQSTMYRWFSWGVASLPEGKSRGLCLALLCAKYRLVSATLIPYYY